MLWRALWFDRIYVYRCIGQLENDCQSGPGTHQVTLGYYHLLGTWIVAWSR